MFAKKQTIIRCALLPILLMTCATAFALSYSDGYFYVGSMLNLYNPRESFEIRFGYSDSMDVATGMGPGINMGLNLTSHLSFPDISADVIMHMLKGRTWIYPEGDVDFSKQMRIYNIMLGGKYRFGHWRIEPYVRAGILFQDIRLQEKVSPLNPDFNDHAKTEFYWGFAPYIGGGISYYITPKIYMSIETLYSNGTGSYKSPYEEYHTIRIGGNHINFAFGVLPF